jgi:hypothetical protein
MRVVVEVEVLQSVSIFFTIFNMKSNSFRLGYTVIPGLGSHGTKPEI